MVSDHLGEMGRKNRRRIHHGQPRHLGAVLVRGADPYGRQAEGRLTGREPLDSRGILDSGVHRQVAFDVQFAPGDLDAAEADDVGLGAQPDVVHDPDRWHDHPQFGGKLPADDADPFGQVAAAPLGERDKLVAELNLQWVQAQQGQGRLRPVQRIQLLLALPLGVLNPRLPRGADQGRSQEHGKGAEDEERQAWEARNDGESEQEARGDPQYLWLGKQLSRKVAAQASLRSRPGHDDAGRG